MSTLPVRGDEIPISTAINLEFIKTIAESGQSSGIEQVGAFHEALFLNRHGQDLERFRQHRQIHEDRLSGLDARLRRLREKLAGEEVLVPVLEDGRPDTQPAPLWNFFDIAMFVTAAAAVVCLLVFGVFNISFNLLESGIVTFTEHPIRAYFWAALLPVGALGVKVGWDFLQSRRKRDIYLWTCLLAGVTAVAIWIGAYAMIYPALSKTTDDQIESMSVFDDGDGNVDYLSRLTSGGAKRIDMILVASQALAEICLSAALGMYLTQLYGKHRPVQLARNPTFRQFDDERCSTEDAVSRERLALAEAKGSETKLLNQLAMFISYSKSLYQKEAALRRDRAHQKRLLIDSLSDELKSRLEAVDNEGESYRSNGDKDLRGIGSEASLR